MINSILVVYSALLPQFCRFNYGWVGYLLSPWQHVLPNWP